MNKKYVAGKTMFALVIVAGLLVGTVALAQTAPSNTPANGQTVNNPTAPSGQTQGTGSNAPSVINMQYGAGTHRNGLGSGRMLGGNFGQRNFPPQSNSTNHRNTGLSIWSIIARAITTILLWIIMVEVIILLLEKLKNHSKQKQ
jgi:hypothetical protein